MSLRCKSIWGWFLKAETCLYNTLGTISFYQRCSIHVRGCFYLLLITTCLLGNSLFGASSSEGLKIKNYSFLCSKGDKSRSNHGMDKMLMSRCWIFAKQKSGCFWLWSGGPETPEGFPKGHYSIPFLVFTSKTGSRLDATGMPGYPKEPEKPWPRVLLSCTQKNWISPWEMHDTSCYREWQGVVCSM